MATSGLELSPTLANIDGQVQDLFRALSSGFQKLDKVKDPNRQSKQLEELTVKMREAKRLIKDFDREIKEEESKNSSEQNKQLNEKKQALIKELNSYVALRKTYTSALGGGRNELLDGGGGGRGEPLVDDGLKLASTMTNQELIDAGRKQMDETDQTLERSKKVVQDTVNIGEQTALTLKSQIEVFVWGVEILLLIIDAAKAAILTIMTDQMGRIVNELDTIQFSIKKASQLVKEISRQLATDKCIMIFLLLIVCGVVAIIVVKVVNPKNKSIVNLPGLAPPAVTTANRRLLLALLE